MKSVFGMCFNWKVLAALGVVAVAILVLAPGLVIAALPLLLLAACPLSMMLMMRGGHGSHGSHAGTHAETFDNARHGASGGESLDQRLIALRDEERRLEIELRIRDKEPALAGDRD